MLLFFLLSVSGLALIPLNALPFLQDAYIPFKELPYAISDGAKCFFGVNSRVNHTVWEADGTAHGSCWTDKANKWGAPTDARCDDCHGAWLPVCGYIVFNCAYNLFIMLVIKHGSAALLWITLTLRLPLVQIAFAISAINNPPDSFHATSIVGLFVILAGLILYRWSSVAGAGAKKDADEAVAEIEAEAGRRLSLNNAEGEDYLLSNAAADVAHSHLTTTDPSQNYYP